VVADVQWQTVRHQVAIAGQVVSVVGERMTKDKNNKPIIEPVMQAIAGARVELSAMPPEFQKHLKLKALQYSDAVWEVLSERPDRTQTTANGTFHFLDLPDGNYALTASLPNTVLRYGTVTKEAIAVSRTAGGAIEHERDSQGNIINFSIELTLPLTAVKGQIVTEDPANSDKTIRVEMAKVQIKETNQITFSNREGNFLFADLEILRWEEQTLTLEVSAPRYTAASVPVKIRPGQTTLLKKAVKLVKL
jgi:hypothetical protein